MLRSGGQGSRLRDALTSTHKLTLNWSWLPPLHMGGTQRGEPVLEVY